MDSFCFSLKPSLFLFRFQHGLFLHFSHNLVVTQSLWVVLSFRAVLFPLFSFHCICIVLSFRAVLFPLVSFHCICIVSSLSKLGWFSFSLKAWLFLLFQSWKCSHSRPNHPQLLLSILDCFYLILNSGLFIIFSQRCVYTSSPLHCWPYLSTICVITIVCVVLMIPFVIITGEAIGKVCSQIATYGVINKIDIKFKLISHT